jgi:hypothetical protein
MVAMHSKHGNKSIRFTFMVEASENEFSPECRHPDGLRQSSQSPTLTRAFVYEPGKGELVSLS